MNGPVAVASPSALASTKTKTLVAAWLCAMEHEKRPATIVTWELYGRTHWVPFFKDAAELASERRLAAYVTARLKSALAATVAKECSALQTLLSWCARKDIGYLAAAPTVPRPPKGAGKKALTKIRVDLTAEQAEAIIEGLPETIRRKERGVGEKRPCRALFRALWETGLRIGTFLRLEAPHDYHRGASELVIRDEADKAEYGRVLPLTAKARAALDSVCPDAGLLFLPVNYRAQLRKAALAAGVPGHLAGHVSHHDFRHGRATHLLDTGTPLSAVSYLLGHKQATTTNLYVHARQTEAKRAIEALDSGHRLGHEQPGGGPSASPVAQVTSEEDSLFSDGSWRTRTSSQWIKSPGQAREAQVFLAFSAHRDARKRTETSDSGHGVPAIERIAERLEAALVAHRTGDPHAWDRVLDAAEIVIGELEASVASDPVRPSEVA